MIARSRVSWLMVGVAMVLFVSCHTITEELPTEPTEATEATQHVGAITIPIILGTSPTPSPMQKSFTAAITGTGV